MVIQLPQLRIVQVKEIGETNESTESEGIIKSHKHREINPFTNTLYRRILSELSSDVPGISKIEGENSEE